DSQNSAIVINDAVEDAFAFGVLQLSTNIILTKTYRGVEGKYMDYLSTLCARKIVPTGPLINNIVVGEFEGEKVAAAVEEVFFGGERFRERARELSKKMRAEEEEENGYEVADELRNLILQNVSTLEALAFGVSILEACGYRSVRLSTLDP
ncbi:UDP-Glycosyltransferase superfamily protein, partial [Striga asiatica]